MNSKRAIVIPILIDIQLRSLASFLSCGIHDKLLFLLEDVVRLTEHVLGNLEGRLQSPGSQCQAQVRSPKRLPQFREGGLYDMKK